jgi:PleD family two-component response regulator
MKPFISKLFHKSRSTFRSLSKENVKPIYERSEFHKQIELERNRVLRNNHQFSLIIFRFNENNDKIFIIEHLAQKISKRVRQIDQIGWYDNNRLGLLLPDTASAGAQVIANDICDNQNDAQPAILFETLSYP